MSARIDGWTGAPTTVDHIAPMPADAIDNLRVVPLEKTRRGRRAARVFKPYGGGFATGAATPDLAPASEGTPQSFGVGATTLPVCRCKDGFCQGHEAPGIAGKMTVLGGVPLLEPEDTTAREGDVAALALAALPTPRMLARALAHAEEAEAQLHRLEQVLGEVGEFDTARPLADRVIVDTHRARGRLADVIERLRNAGVTS